MKMNHIKSVENPLSGTAEPLSVVRRPEKPACEQQSRAGATPDGVYVDGMVRNGVGTNRETCTGEASASTSATSPATGEGATANAGVGAADSSVDLWASITHGEQSGSAYIHATKRSKGSGDGSAKAKIRTPAKKVRKLQIALYRKAKAEPKWRFYSLYGEVCRTDVLRIALGEVKANRGAAGVDGLRPEAIQKIEGGEEAWIEKLAEELRAKKYQASPVRRKYIAKGDGKMRALGIPTVKDRVVQAALMQVLMPIYEADFHPNSFGYRPKRNAQQAMGKIKEELRNGKTEMIDADLSGYFDNIDHRKLMRQLVKRIADGSVLGLVKSWLRAPVMEECEDGKRRVHGSKKGTPQGGVISPLLANVYLSDLDHGVNNCRAEAAVMVRYADDFVILCPKGRSAAIYERLEGWLQRRGLQLNEKKTRRIDARQESFEFLGWKVTPRKTKRRSYYHHIEPSVKSRGKLMDRIRAELNGQTQWRESAEVIAKVNRITQGWSQYFRYGHWRPVFHQMDDLVAGRLRKWLWLKHRKKHAAYGHYTKRRLQTEYGLYKMEAV